MTNLTLSSKELLNPTTDVLNNSFISIESQHLFCNNCDNDVDNVSSLTFKISSIDGVKEFTLPPASAIELTQLAILFGVSHAFSSRVIFNTLPGFEISFIRNSDQSVRVSFLADKDILTFMGLSTSCASVHTTIAISELNVIEDSIRATLAPCQN